MSERVLFAGPLGNRCFALRVRGSALLVYLSGLAWIMFALMTRNVPNRLLASLVLGPGTIVTGGSLVFLANTIPGSVSPGPEWPSILYAVLGAFSVGLTIPSFPPAVPAGIGLFYACAMFLSLPGKSDEPVRVLPTMRSTVLGTPVGIHAQPVPRDGQETV